MADMTPNKTAMPVQDEHERIKNFKEVALGYSKEQAVGEAKRCINCKHKPCVNGCPVNVDIPSFLAAVANEDIEGGYDIIKKTNSLPAICGRVCPQESQCEALCVRGIKGEPVGIGRVERFCADFCFDTKSKTEVEKPKADSKKVAIIGSGPSGLACAGDLIKKGYNVTIFEALHVSGGVLVYGIPEFRLPKRIVEKEINNLLEQGVKLEKNAIIGKTLSIDELMGEFGFDAVFIGSGAGLPKFMNIPGENLKGVFSSNEYLTRINLMKAYEEGSDTPIFKAQNVAVVGGGNVAMDAARCARRLGANVKIVYRRTANELPARAEEIEHAMEEGIEFNFLTSPTEIVGDENGFVKQIICERMELSEPDASGRARPVRVEGSEYAIDIDCVIMSIGTSPNPLIKDTTNGLETQRWGGIIVDEATGATSKKGVYAGGDAVTGAATVILAMGAGKTAAKAIEEYLK